MRFLVGIILLSIIFSSSVTAQVRLLSEDFSEGIPGEWQVVDNLGGTGGVWQDNNPGGRGPFSFITEPFVVGDSDYNFFLVFDTDLITPSMDVSNLTWVVLTYDHELRRFSSEKGTVSISIDGGNTWDEIASYSEKVLEERALIDISSYAAGESDVRIKFNYSTGGATYQFFWVVDNIHVLGVDSEGVFIDPASSQESAGIGGTAKHVMTVINNTGAKATFDISYDDNNWEVSGSDEIMVEAGGIADFIVTVNIPRSAEENATDNVTVTISDTTGKYSDISMLTSTAIIDWFEAGNLPIAVFDNAIVSNGNRIYLIGGLTDPYAIPPDPIGSDVIAAFSEEKGTWETLSPAPVTLDFTVAAVPLNDIIYVFAGGIDNQLTPQTPTFLAYNIANDSWDDTLSDVPGDGTWGGQRNVSTIMRHCFSKFSEPFSVPPSLAG